MELKIKKSSLEVFQKQNQNGKMKFVSFNLLQPGVAYLYPMKTYVFNTWNLLEQKLPFKTKFGHKKTAMSYFLPY